METNQQINCYNCSKPLPKKGYFCGGCLTQVKCKSCESLLEKDDVGCVNCGTPKEMRGEIKTGLLQNINTFRLHETATDRTIEAAFSDDVAKDLAGTLRDAATAGRLKAIVSNIASHHDINETDDETAEFVEAEVVNSDNGVTKTEEIKKLLSTTNTTIPEEFPAMRSIVMNNFPSSEVEWIIVYAFYSSNFGEKTFTKKDIANKYEESGRKTKQRIKNLTGSITNAVKAKYINPINDEDFSIVTQGLQKVKEIITRTSGSSSKTRSTSNIKKDSSETTDVSGSKSKKKLNGVKSHKRLTEINFYPTGQKSLVDFIKDYNIKNDNEKNLLFTYYLSEVLKIKSVTLGHLYTCYDEVNHKIPENMINSLSNTKNRTGWLKNKQFKY